jgi:hypothetical protein
MATAYICLLRQDFNDDGLQVLDLKPNASQKTIYDPPAQTTYLNYTVVSQNNTVATTTVLGVVRTNAEYRGLAAYLLDNTAGAAVAPITADQANAISLAIRTRMVAGSSLTAANIVAVMLACGVVNNAASTWTLAGILSICQGQVYRVPANAIIAVAGVKAVPKGVFAVWGDPDYQLQRIFELTGFLLLSAGQGILAQLKDPDYTWLNPLFTYGATGTALMVNGTHIGAAGTAPAVVVYDLLGNVV